jgi:hypothetical protein
MRPPVTAEPLTILLEHNRWATHRAQCLNLLRRLNFPGLSDRLPDLDVNDWQYETECKP